MSPSHTAFQGACGLLLCKSAFPVRKVVFCRVRIRYQRQTETGAVYTLIQEGHLFHVRSRVPQLELRWRDERWTPERNWLEREFTYPLDVGLDEYLARFLPHLNGKVIELPVVGGVVALATDTDHAHFHGKWFNFDSQGSSPEAIQALKSILHTAADFYGVPSLFG